MNESPPKSNFTPKSSRKTGTTSKGDYLQVAHFQGLPF